MDHFCNECGDKLTGRSDKKFCGDQCRTQYHNKSALIENRQIRRVNNVLRRNRKILSEFLGEKDITRISRENLLLKGFDFSFHTQQWSNQEEAAWLIIYDYGCRMEKEEEIVISTVEKIMQKKLKTGNFSSAGRM